MATDFLVACQFVTVSMLGLIIFKVALQLQFQDFIFCSSLQRLETL